MKTHRNKETRVSDRTAGFRGTGVWVLPETAGCTQLGDKVPLHPRQEAPADPIGSVLSCLTQLLSSLFLLFPPFTPCLFPAVLLPPHVHIKWSLKKAYLQKA